MTGIIADMHRIPLVQLRDGFKTLVMLLALAFGVWGEASEAVHSLVHQIATSPLRTAMFLPHQGVKGKSSIDELAQLVGSLRRQLSVVAVDAQARLLLTGLRDK